MLINMILGACVILALIGYVIYKTSLESQTWDEDTQQWLTDVEVRDGIDRHNRRIANR